MPKGYKQENKHLSVSAKPTSEFSTFFSFYTENWAFKMSSCGKDFKRTAQKYEVSTLRTRSHDSYYFASSPTGRACNLRRTANLGSEMEQRAFKRYLEFLLVFRVLPVHCPFPIWSASSHAAKRALVIIPSLRLSGPNKSHMLHPFCMVTLLSFYCRHNDRRKLLKHGNGPVYVLLGAQSQAYAAATGVPQHHTFFYGKLCIRLVGWGWKITVYNALQAVVLLYKF